MIIAPRSTRSTAKLVELFAQRMDTAAGIAAYKKEHGLPVLDPVREREKLLDVAAQAPEDMRDYTASLYTMLFELSRCYQGPAAGEHIPADRGNSDRH